MTQPPVPHDVVRTLTALYAAGMSPSAVRRRLRNGTWQMPLPDVVLTRPGALTLEQKQAAALLWSAPAGALFGRTAAALDGLKGYPDSMVHVMVDVESGLRSRSFVIVHRTHRLHDRHIHPTRSPRRARIERAVVDIARQMTSAGDAFAVVAAAVQQRLTRVDDIRGILEDFPQAVWKRELLTDLGDIEGGSQSLPELQAYRALLAAGIPAPDRQVVRLENGRRHYLDLYWDAFGLCIEIDGRFHLSVDNFLADMLRDAEITINGASVVRMPATLVRHRPEAFAHLIGRLLTSRGWSQPGVVVLK